MCTWFAELVGGGWNAPQFETTPDNLLVEYERGERSYVASALNVGNYLSPPHVYALSQA